MSPDDRVRELARRVRPANVEAIERAAGRHGGLVKPQGSLGRLEDLGAKLAGISGRCPPAVPENPAVVVCAGDHGVLDRGVSPWPGEVTAAMVENICAGGAAVNAVAKTVGARVVVLDVGVAGNLDPHPSLRDAKIRSGTRDLSRGPAMGRDEAALAVLAGIDVAEDTIRGGVDLLVTGDMGIGNTTPAAALISAFTGRPPEETTGRGTGIDDETFLLKVGVVREALDLHRPDPGDPIGVLAAVGGLEHAAIVGVILAGAASGVPVVLDGVVSNSAALVAHSLAADSRAYVVAGHFSPEPGAKIVLDHLGLEPLLDLEMRLGEGTGGLLAVPLVRAAARTLAEMATLEDLGFG